MSFGQSFQVTPIQMAATVSSLVNGGDPGNTPFRGPGPGRRGRGTEGIPVSGEGAHCFQGDVPYHAEPPGGGGVPGIRQKRLSGGISHRREDRHIPDPPKKRQSVYFFFYRFAPADDPQILGMCVIYDPQGVYYGGTIAAPVIGDIFRNVLPYLGIEKQ